jgi:serine/threonine-protein kinase RsbW
VNSGGVELELTVPATAENIPVLRHAVSGFLEGVAITGERASDVLLAVTEACTNVVQHAYRDDHPASDPQIELIADRNQEVLSIAVRDLGHGFAPRVDSPGLGLGLPVIAALTRTVEIRPLSPCGTEVVMTFAVEGAEANG